MAFPARGQGEYVGGGRERGDIRLNAQEMHAIGHAEPRRPLAGGFDQAAAAGIKAVIQPGGSMRDDEVIAAANEHGIAMVFTGTRHFRH